ncbi:MAG: carboxylating nicotinate-nucleotide diphosphorylase [Rickettsiales bacterium]
MTGNIKDLRGDSEITDIIKRALAEDIGTGDITSSLLIPEDKKAKMKFVARQDMVTCGLPLIGEVYSQIDKDISVAVKVMEGKKVQAGTVLAIIKGSARSLLAGERVALNIIQRMCGVATLTDKYVEAVMGTKAIILDTRKTMVNLRVLDKYATSVGGARNHRVRLDDMILIKDNHIALSGGVKQAVKTAKSGAGDLKIIVECDTIEQVKDAAETEANRIMLDNMDVDTLRKAVEIVAGKIPLEASGGVDLNNIAEIAKTGVDYISVGAITHSAPAVDIGADIDLTSGGGLLSSLAFWRK